MKPIAFQNFARSLFRRKVVFCATIVVFLVTSCAGAKQAMTQEPTVETSVLTTPTMTLTQPIPTQVRKSPTLTPTSDWYSYWTSISGTQAPVTISTNEPDDPKFITKNTIVTFVTPANDGMNYLNLDDLNNNEPENSDVIITHASGSGGTNFEIDTSNGATYYYSDLHGMTISTCLEHFPFTRMDSYIYNLQNRFFDTGRDYCVLTNEGHLSIIRMYPESRYEVSADYELMYLEVIVTTYSEVLVQAFTPFPTITPGSTHIPDRYAGMNLTQKQKEGLDISAQTFLKAVQSDDRKTIINMLDFPVTIDRDTYKWPTYAKNETDFLSVYGEIFTKKILDEIFNASLAGNMGIHANNKISLLLPDCLIYFHPDGKIYQISLSSIWWETEPGNYHVSQGDSY